jgi:hypothetical protein
MPQLTEVKEIYPWGVRRLEEFGASGRKTSPISTVRFYEFVFEACEHGVGDAIMPSPSSLPTETDEE